MVIDYINENYQEELCLKELAAISAFSPFHFHRIFKSVVGENLHSFVRRIRLEKSCALLCARSDIKILDIALRCGFLSHSSFTKAFRKFFRVSPVEWRAQSQSRNSKNGTTESNRRKENEISPQYFGDVDFTNLYSRRNRMDIRIETLPVQKIAYLRRIGSYGPENVKLMEELKKWAAARELLSESSVILGIAHDNPDVTPPDKCRYDCCIILPEDYNHDDSINEGRLPGGKYALYEIKHTPEKVLNAWNDIFSVWLPENGFRIDDRPLFERYKPSRVISDKLEISCEICLPVAPL